MLAKITYQINDTVIMRPQVPASQFHILNKPSTDEREKLGQRNKVGLKKFVFQNKANYTDTIFLI